MEKLELELEQQGRGKKEEVTHFISVVREVRKSIILLGGSRTLPYRPSHSSNI